jgi:tetratricopeptide (TPR) repeat protein
LLRYDATRLFAKHAAAARTSVELNATNASAVAALCARLAGLPLAVELAAARLPELTPQQILAQLEEQLRQLAAAGPALAPPQLALRAVVDWSLGRLRPVEQQLFGRLSLFAGGWDVAAVDSICIGPGGVELDSIDAMELFADYGLLVRCPTPQQRRRFRLPEALRPFAAQRLQADPVLAELHYQHATHYLTDPLVGAPERRDDDLANLCAALGWAAAHGHIEMAQRLVGVLWRLAWQRGDVAEIQRWVAQALASRPSKRSLPSTLRAVVAAGAGQRAFERGNYARAAERWQESLLLCEALDDEMGATQARLGLGAALRLQGQRARSEACYAQALATLRASHDAPGVRVALRTMAAAALRQHDLVEAAKLYHDLLALAQRANDTYAEAQALRQLGVVAQHEGDQARARSYYWRSLLLFLQRNDQRAAAQGLIDVAGTLERQHVGLAARLLGAADLHCVVSQAKPWSEHPANARLVKQIRRRCGNVYFEYSYRVGWWQDWSKALAEAAATVDEQSDQGVQPVGRPATPKSLALL